MLRVIVPDRAGGPAPVESQTFCLIVFPQGVEDDLIELLDQLGVPGYTEVQKVTGRGPRGRHFDTAVWPGADGAIFTVVTDDQAAALSTALTNYSHRLEGDSQGLYGVHVFTWPCRQLV
ncbi:MAG TPA: hypothetical protein VF937_02475 [Chloroflexota bacterium]